MLLRLRPLLAMEATMRDATTHDHDERWDSADIAALYELLERGLTHAECADRLGRTVGAIRSKLYRLRNP